MCGSVRFSIAGEKKGVEWFYFKSKVLIFTFFLKTGQFERIIPFSPKNTEYNPFKTKITNLYELNMFDIFSQRKSQFHEEIMKI